MKDLEIYNQSLLLLKESIRRLKDIAVYDRDDYQSCIANVMTIGEELSTVECKLEPLMNSLENLY